jgi:hypothetical protein
MKITRLVILFNKDKILLGIGLSILAFVMSSYANQLLSQILIGFGLLILVNIGLSLYASFKLYDRSNLYKPEVLFQNLNFKEDDTGIFLHASFDPISRKLERLFEPKKLKTYNIYGNRHEDEKSIKISNKVFPPNPNQKNIDPTNFDDEQKSVNYIFAITSAHEILSHQKRKLFFKETKRILKDDGTLILCEQMRNCINFLFFNIGAFHFVSMKNWKKAISEAGLQIVKIEKLTPWGTILYIKK